jgi:flagellar protein FlbD
MPCFSSLLKIYRLFTRYLLTSPIENDINVFGHHICSFTGNLGFGGMMIKVTRLNNSELWVNAELIEFIEATPDTVISLIGHTKIVVKESPQVIVDAVVDYRQKVFGQRPQLIESEE